MTVLAQVRGLLSVWHPRLGGWHQSPAAARAGAGAFDREQAWPLNRECRAALARMQDEVTRSTLRPGRLAGAGGDEPLWRRTTRLP
ncbi:hypothetical protein [Amycolatopsis sp. FDAARGOS 1241]|uniref:hypothetical protein n=1 Tax=Amycolatopsis sp. FDAARGOS 1241 TaxID=2778070 RepID=UPI001951BA1A|nr:hypothetical protein [Amycolatopsis sp. FDAARGOS 1241]QRP42802.1 hypothetical protein I6J71_25380 [Amycolatopsis sp. FDAARGOS 1241]